jgi:hypothetical protein
MAKEKEIMMTDKDDTKFNRTYRVNSMALDILKNGKPMMTTLEAVKEAEGFYDAVEDVPLEVPKKKITIKELEEKIHADSYSIRNGIITLRWEFFYTHGVTTAHKERLVMTMFPTAKILDSGEVWKRFNGRSSTANSSHWFVKFTV